MKNLSECQERKKVLVYELTKDPTTGRPVTALSQTAIPPPFHLKYGFNERLLDKQNGIQSLDSAKFRNAKTLVNPYEFIGKKVSGKTVPQLTEFNTRFPMKISRAYYKMLEILCNLKLTKDTGHVSALCLCEGPGGFISAILDYYSDDLKEVCGVTLSPTDGVPGFESSPCPATAKTKVFYSDLLDFDYSFLSPEQKFDLVTADGGFEFTDQECIQEQLSSKLVYAEVIWALRFLAKGGSFILKVFSMYTQASCDILKILSANFSRVILSKPKTSRPCNNEKYILCINFTGGHSQDELPLPSGVQFIERILKPGDRSTSVESQLLDANCIFAMNTYRNLNKAFYFAKRAEPVTITESHIAAIQEMTALFDYTKPSL